MRPVSSVQALQSLLFQSTHPLRDATLEKRQISRYNVFQSTHPLRDATWYVVIDNEDNQISIHAPLTGCDVNSTDPSTLFGDFNPRTPYGMRRHVECLHEINVYFNPRTPYGMRPGAIDEWYGYCYFNPRTPYGMRLIMRMIKKNCTDFNPRTPYGMRP